jgi:AraC-like DNA-binding protein
MPTVAVMVAESGMHELPREQIGAVAAVRLCETRELLVTLATEGVVDAVISDIRDGAGASVLPAFAEIHRRVPSLPLILYCLPTPEVLRDLPSFIAVTRGLHLVLRNCEHLGLALRPILRATRVPGAGETLARHVVPLVPGPFRPFLLVSALKASPKLKVGTAAAWSGVPRRTLERSLLRAHLPSARALLGSCTALHAAWWLDVQGWPAKQVVAEMGFPHTSAVVRVLRRNFGCTMRSLRDAGGFPELLKRFELTLLAPQAGRTHIRAS